jgi:hypothetical protein
MALLGFLINITLLAWMVLTIRVALKLIKISRVAWKKDYAWFSMQSGYWKGFGIGFAWGTLLFGLLIASPRFGLMIAIIVQACIAAFFTKGNRISSLERQVWFSVPFLVWPLWLAVLQGQRNGELSTPNP